jgi:DNA-binding CsgD family transcriptional regulator
MNKKNLKHLLTLFIFFMALTAIAADIKSIGTPYLQNYTKSIYLSGNQNWSVARDNSGVMYFGNAQGLLTFDGKYWQQYKMPNQQIVRSVATAADGTVYSGSYGEFGYWKMVSKHLRYTSLIKLLPKNHQMTDEIWKIYVDGNRVLFQSFSTIYIYQNHKISVVKSSLPFLFMHKVGQRYLIEVLGKGLFELKGENLTPLAYSGSQIPTSILSILPYKNGKMLIGTSKQGLFIYDGKTYSPFSSIANEFLKTYQLNNGARVLGKYYAYGTILNGLIIIDEDGHIIQRINKSSGLQNNTVLSVYTDKEQNLWAGLDNGIDRIELNTPLYFYFDKTGKFGTVYSSIIHDGKIYLGTNQGLFFSSWAAGKNNTFNNFDFKLIPNSQGQVWDLSVVDGQLLCGHNDGTYKVKGTVMKKISEVSGGWTIRKLNENYLIQGTYNGLALFKKNQSGEWEFVSRISNFNEPSRYVEMDTKGDLWVSHPYKGLYRLTLSQDFKKVVSKTYFDEKNGLPGNYNLNIFTIGDKMLFSSAKGFLNYDEISGHFNKYESLNKALGSFATSNKIISAGYRKYWFINHGKMSLVTFGLSGKLQIDSNRFNVLDGRMVQYYENISRINDQFYLISVDDGFVIYDALTAVDHARTVLPNVLIRRIEDITDTYAALSETGSDGTGTLMELPYNRNNLRISYALPYYRQAKIKYQYFLEGYSKQWSDWSTASQKDFTNLGWGKYKFLVRAKLNDQSVSKITAFEFAVLPPFYANNWAMAIYVVLLASFLFMGKKLYEKKLQKDQEAIKLKLQAEKEEFLQKEAEATEKQIIKLQTERLHAELAGKNRELANSAMSLVYKNELLQKLSDEILKVKDENGKRLPEEQLRKIQKVIDEGMNDERDWNLFENSFNEAHENFFKKLKIHHPDLVPNDLKLCAYLLMNMSSKEIASLLNISLRGVEIRRYRLRKKLKVPHDKNLVEFLMEI